MNKLAIKFALQKMAKIPYPVQDFMAGVDPTGTNTIRLASRYKKRHKLHQGIGDIGGMIGGTALGAALPAGVLALTALAMRKRRPAISSEFVTAAKGSLDVLRPGRLLKHIKSIPNKSIPSARTMAALMTIPTAVAGGLLNASSAHMQYDAAKKNGLTKIARKSHFEVLKKNKVPLTPEERQRVMDSKAVWHHGPNGEETAAVWKSVDKSGKATYVTATHRAYNARPTLRGAISRYHKFIKGTA